MRIKYLCAFLLTSVVTAIGQVDHQHVMPQAVVIDGKDHPDQIPDITAYRLLFVAASIPASASDEQRARQAAQLSRIHLANADSEALVRGLGNFNQQYGDLIKNYNDSVELAVRNGSEPDSDSMLRRRDALVQATINELRSSLTTDGLTTLAAFVQSEKSRMKIARVAPNR